MKKSVYRKGLDRWKYKRPVKGKSSPKSIMRRYKVDLKTAEDLIERKCRACECCGLSPIYIAVSHIDHCHTTGKIRGTVCGSCNTIIGQYETGLFNTAKKHHLDWIKYQGSKDAS
jgi:hypothetical protein